PPYFSEDPNHQGLLLHSIYHRPNNWDHVPTGRKIPCGESSLWGDYHLLELALLIRRLATGGQYCAFFDQPGYSRWCGNLPAGLCSWCTNASAALAPQSMPLK